jgi:hypothetical protein
MQDNRAALDAGFTRHIEPPSPPGQALHTASKAEPPRSLTQLGHLQRGCRIACPLGHAHQQPAGGARPQPIQPQLLSQRQPGQRVAAVQAGAVGLHPAQRVAQQAGRVQAVGQARHARHPAPNTALAVTQGRLQPRLGRVATVGVGQEEQGGGAGGAREEGGDVQGLQRRAGGAGAGARQAGQHARHGAAAPPQHVAVQRQCFC